MKLIDSIRRRLPSIREAAPPKELQGRPIVKQHTWAAGTRERNITPALLVEDRNVAPVVAALGGLSGLCFPGFDFVLKPTEEGNDRAQAKIDKILSEIQAADARIGRIGKARNVGTLGLVRRAFLEGYTFRQVVVEYVTERDGQWEHFAEVQILPGESFASSPFIIAGQDRYIADKMLPGIVADTVDDITRYHQGLGGGKFQEIEPENVLYIQDTKIPENTSLIKAIVPSIEAWKEVRSDAMLTMHRVGAPNQTAQMDAKGLADLVGAGLIGNTGQPTIQSIQEYAEDLVQNQGINRTQLSLAGMKLQYPTVPIPINPWDADTLLQKEIVDHFFHTNVLEVTAQAISATNAPSKDLLDNHIVGERETYGQPFEQLWNQWLLWNGYDDLKIEFHWWNWAPKDQVAERAHNLASFEKGAMLVNDYRAMSGWSEYDDDQLSQLMKERVTLKSQDLSQVDRADLKGDE